MNEEIVMEVEISPWYVGIYARHVHEIVVHELDDVVAGRGACQNRAMAERIAINLGSGGNGEWPADSGRVQDLRLHLDTVYVALKAVH